MGYHSLFRSPKKEEQQVPDTEFADIKNEEEEEDLIDIMDELQGIWSVDDENEEKLLQSSSQGQLGWDYFMHWDHEGEEEQQIEYSGKFFADQESHNNKVIIKKENNPGFVDVIEMNVDDEKRVSLNLNLNYQEVIDAWSDRGSLWAAHDDFSSSSMASNGGGYYGEVPVMEEEKTRREASVLRYKEKRQNRLFSKKIRYEVRKLNADKRPRLKGRFVKRVS